jgi:hypothetical protein
MQQMMIYWQSIVPQHVLGVFTPIIRRADCVSLPMIFSLGCGCCGSDESGSAMCALWRGCCLSGTHLAFRLFGTTIATAKRENNRQWHAVFSPDDGRKDARNMLRNNWLTINHHLLHLVGLAFICLYKMHGHSSIIFLLYTCTLIHARINSCEMQKISCLCKRYLSHMLSHYGKTVCYGDRHVFTP